MAKDAPDDTPMRRQYLAAKAAHPGMILLFRMGDFYETFDDDAELVSRLLGLTLTTRDRDTDHPTPMAGFPHHQLESYLRKLLQGGHRVAVCDQMEDPAAARARGEKTVRREVTRVVTPGTVTEDELLDPRRPNHLVALRPAARGGPAGVAWADLSCGSFFAADLPPGRLADELARLAAVECLLSETEAARLDPALRAALPDTLTARPDWTFDPDTARAALRSHFGVATLAGFGFDDDAPCLAAAGALLVYLQETLRTSLAHLRVLRPYRPESVLALDEVTRRSLELTRTLRDGGRDGSLLSVIDRTVTPMGARLLHDWLVAPLADIPRIDARLDAVGELHGRHAARQELRAWLAKAADLQRLTARVSTNRATPRDLGAVGRTLALLPEVKQLLAGASSALVREVDARLDPCPDLREELAAALVDSPPMSSRDGGVIRPGYRPELDELRQASAAGKGWLANYQAEQVTATGIPSLKVGYNQVFGYYIEITNTHSAKVPPGYSRKQTLKNCERYVTPELKEYEEKILTAEDRSKQLEQDLFNQLRERAAAQTPRLLAAADALAALDVLAALAELASERRYVRPRVVAEPVLAVEAGRHPVLDLILPAGTVVPNDIRLSPDGGVFWLITGPNMAGKSTFLRQAALLTLMAQAGSFVPAAAATVGLTDRVFTRVGASDELGRGQSTFMVEMTEAANILHNATARSLVILDEIGRGTSTYDGVALAWAIAEHLHDVVGCRALFATHYHELARLAERLHRLRNYNVLVREAAGEVVFLHQIAPGHAGKSYGVHVARLAGVPAAVVERAEEILANLETPKVLPAAPLPTRLRRPRPAGGPDLFAPIEG